MAAVGLDSTLSSLGLSRAFAEQLARSLQVRTASTGPKTGAEALLYAQYNAIGLQALGSSNGNMSAAGWVPGPQDYAAGGPSGLANVGNGFGGLNLSGGFATDPLMKSLQAALANNPQFRAQLEGALGGQVLGSNANGALNVWQPGPNANTIGKTTRGLLQTAPPKGSIQYSLGNMGTEVTPAALNGPQGGILRGLMQMEANIASFTANMGTGGIDPAVAQQAKTAGVDIKNPRFEDLVFLNLMSYTSKKEKEIMGKVNDLGQNAGALQAQEGFFGGLTAGVGGTTARGLGVNTPELGAFPQLGGVQAQTVGTVAGMANGGLTMVQAGAAGGGGQIVDAQGNVVNPNNMSETAKQQMMQKMMGDLQKLYEMLSNMNKAMHDMQMVAVRNIKG